MRSELDIAGQALRAATGLAASGLPRDAVSRAYFAMFHAATAMLLAENMSFESHEETIGAFGRLFAKAGRVDRRFHRDLINAEDFREIADYVRNAPISAEKVSDTIRTATEFLAMAETFLEGAGGKLE
ncbi:MAG: HEPN domain-containing protein [Terriglobia bacterium]